MSLHDSISSKADVMSITARPADFGMGVTAALPLSPGPESESRLLYQFEDGALLCGDCRHLLELPNSSVDLVVTDPPFNLGFKYGEGISDRLTKDQYRDFTRAWLTEALRVLKPGGQLFALMPEHLHVVWRTVVPSSAKVLHWMKTFGSHLHSGATFIVVSEPILWIVHGDRPNVFNRPRRFNLDTDCFIGSNAAGESRVTPEMRRHPTSRPTWLFEEFIARATNLGDVVLDSMVGSGAAAVAARRLGRRFIAYDLNPVYLGLVHNRIRRAVFDPRRLDRATNATQALREMMGWALGNQRKFIPFASGRPHEVWGRFGRDHIAIRREVLRAQFDKWGYNEDSILRQWAESGLLYHEKGKFTRVERFATRTCRVVAIRV